MQWNTYSAMKTNKLLKHATAWMNLQYIMLSEKARFKRLQPTWFQLYDTLENEKNCRKRKYIKTDEWLLEVRGGCRCWNTKRQSVIFWRGRTVVYLNCGDATLLNTFFKTQKTVHQKECFTVCKFDLKNNFSLKLAHQLLKFFFKKKILHLKYLHWCLTYFTTEWSKSEREKQIPYANTYIWNLKKKRKKTLWRT